MSDGWNRGTFVFGHTSSKLSKSHELEPRQVVKKKMKKKNKMNRGKREGKKRRRRNTASS